MEDNNVAKVIYSYLILCFTNSSLYGHMRYSPFDTIDYALMPLAWLVAAVIFYFFIKVFFAVFANKVWLDRVDYIYLSIKYYKS